MAFAANHPALLAPAALGAALLLLVAVESIGGPAAPVVPPASFVAATTAPAAIAAGNAAAAATTIDARPLFSATRRPTQSAAAAAPASEAPRLSAIFIGGTTKTCVFDEDGHALVAREGGHAGPYTILAIAADRVTVAAADGQRVLRPTWLAAGSAEASATSPPVAPPVPALQNLLARLRGMRGQ